MGYWSFLYKDQVILIITDESHNRMRIISPVAETSTMDEPLLKLLMEANFNRALDARYALNGEYLWSAFIHPLAELGDGFFIQALDQVATLSINYGSSYSSGEFIFGGGEDPS